MIEFAVDHNIECDYIYTIAFLFKCDYDAEHSLSIYVNDK